MDDYDVEYSDRSLNDTDVEVEEEQHEQIKSYKTSPNSEATEAC